MRGKLSLNLDDLTVDTFDTTAPAKARGTVFGEQCTCWTQCGQNTCPGCPTCDASCNGSCGDTCAGTCYNTCDDHTCVGCNTAGEDTCQFRCTQTAAYTYCNGVECW